MKILIPLSGDGTNELAKCARAGLFGYSTQTAQHGRLVSIYLYFGDDILQVKSTINHVKEWEEIGTLEFRCLAKNEICPDKISVPPTWLKVNSIARLVIEEVEFKAECGVAIQNKENESLVILPGALPFTVEMRAEFYSSDFQPEYDIEKYKIKYLAIDKSNATK